MSKPIEQYANMIEQLADRWNCSYEEAYKEFYSRPVVTKIIKARQPRHGKSKEAHNAGMFKYRYRITKEHFFELLKQQNYRCACCGTDNFGKRGPMMDHDHKQKMNRAILCTQCNTGLGYFCDD